MAWTLRAAPSALRMSIRRCGRAEMIWKIFARLPRKSQDFEDYAKECYAAGVIAVGWNDLGNLNAYESRAELQKRFRRLYPEKRRQTVAQQVGALWKYRAEVKPGHLVLCPDSSSDRLYVGRVLPGTVFFKESILGGRCSFGHRRRVRWFRVLTAEEVHRIWPGRRFGGNQTVARIKNGASQLLEFLKEGRRIRRGHPRLPIRPDMAWGKEAEARAMSWLRTRGYRPKDVAHLNKGWDIDCGRDKFEVKGRKSLRSAIHLTSNEWLAARKLKERYTVLIFTAPTKEVLERTSPVQIVNPTITESWQRRISYEFILEESLAGVPHNIG